MKNETRQLFRQYQADQAAMNGVADASESFAITPSVQQTLESRIQESSDFLGLVNIAPVDEIKGEKLGLGANGPIASRTDTKVKDRQPRDMAALDGTGYECQETDYDTFVRWKTLDMWARFKDFQVRLSRSIQKQMARDRLMVAFNGISSAVETDIEVNPLLQDLNKGWLQYMRENAPQRVMGSGKVADKVQIGAAGDYKTLDGVVFDAVSSLVQPWHAAGGDLVAILPRSLMHDKLFPLVDNQTAPTEMLAASIVRSQRRLGDLQAIAVPFMKEGSILITSTDNLSIYWQDGSRRRHIRDNPARKRVETFDSSNDAYVVEDLGKACLIENITML